jgi:hypothetical protein
MTPQKDWTPACAGVTFISGDIMQKFSTVFLAAILFAVIAGFCNGQNDGAEARYVAVAEAKKETAYERVMRTGELRCGYFSWKPAFIKDPNTGEMSGIFHDYMEEIGRALKLKIVWAEEVALGEFPTAIAAGRIDAMCSSTFVTSERARVTRFYHAALLCAFTCLCTCRKIIALTILRLINSTIPAYKVIILEGWRHLDHSTLLFAESAGI